MYRLIKKFYGEDTNTYDTKTYANKQDATNAGNSWKNDCTIDQNIRKGRNFEVTIKN
jgi:hypothetical protein